MFKFFATLHTPEWLKIINPKGLVDRILACFKFLVPRTCIITNKPLRYKHSIIRKGYIVLSFKGEDVTYVADKLIAGGDTHNAVYPYRVKTSYPVVEILGCGYTDAIGIRNYDYIVKAGCFWFREHPSKFCYTYIKGGETVYQTIAFCADYEHTIQAFKPVSDVATTPEEAQTYDNLIVQGFSGISNAMYLKHMGILTNNGVHGNIIKQWVDKDRTFIITDTGNFVSMYNDQAIAFIKDNKIIIPYIRIPYKHVIS